MRTLGYVYTSSAWCWQFPVCSAPSENVLGESLQRAACALQAVCVRALPFALDHAHASCNRALYIMTLFLQTSVKANLTQIGGRLLFGFEPWR